MHNIDELAWIHGKSSTSEAPESSCVYVEPLKKELKIQISIHEEDEERDSYSIARLDLATAKELRDILDKMIKEFYV